jgi:hypothetical protein
MLEQRVSTASRTKLQTITIGIHGIDSPKKRIPSNGFIVLCRCNELFTPHSSNTVGQAESTEPIVWITKIP